MDEEESNTNLAGANSHWETPTRAAKSPSSKPPARPATAPICDASRVLPSLRSAVTPTTGYDRSIGAPSPMSAHSEAKSVQLDIDYDWASFLSAYASGKWDPQKTPNPPISTIASTSTKSPLASPESALASSPTSVLPEPASTSTEPFPKKLPEARTPTAGVDDVPGSSSRSITRQAAPSDLSLPLHRMRNSFSSGSTTPSIPEVPPPISPSVNAERQTAAAALRLAGARNPLLSPLALPSPEHELTDPMRGVTAMIPGTHHIDSTSTSKAPRLSRFWTGTQDVREPSTLSTIEGSPSSTPLHTPPARSSAFLQSPKFEIAPAPPPSLWSSAPLSSASAPVKPQAQPRDPVETPEDYFGSATVPPSSSPASALSASSLSSTTTISVPPHSNSETSHPTHISRSSTDDGAVGSTSAQTVPVGSKRASLTRQSSSPLPITISGHDDVFSAGRRLTEAPVVSSRSVKEEQMFRELGYLVSPLPPDENERLRALYKFNIWNTGPDANFDRIIHLAKLVFNTKGAFISLIDDTEQWFKASSRINSSFLERDKSLCSHTILQRGEEPMTILDTQSDWRFACHPSIQGGPKIRFYAGAPLRTSDGFNIGTLAVFDESPREDFTPRHRHTLKEFAAIVMREMELWRDKIQLRVRDRIQNSMEEFSRECLEVDHTSAERPRDHLEVVSSSMDKIYQRAANLVRTTLDIDGVLIMDVSQTDMTDNIATDTNVSIVLHHGDPQNAPVTRSVSADEYAKLIEFFTKFPEGKISEGIIPACLRPFIPSHIRYALTVPIFNVDRRPFALLCTYSMPAQQKRYLEGHELSYLRAIGVIILSAVLKRRMMLADKAKSLFISNISHELRTPLHGILAAAELLNDTQLSASQLSFLHTVQACGTSLVETVNHVLDFTKLSGNTKMTSIENSLAPSDVDLMELVEEAVDGCWVGFHARQAVDSSLGGIGSVYAPPSSQQKDGSALRYVEAVIDIQPCSSGWTLGCEKGGIRRILMNLFGNALKFTSDGFVHVVLKQINKLPDQNPDTVRLELSVTDTGKGINQYFLRNQLFHPFSQENPLQTGTGLGLAIVNSIVKSMNGTIEVFSEEAVGTEVKVVFPAYLPLLKGKETSDHDWSKLGHSLTVALEEFDLSHKGTRLLHSSLVAYLKSWWGFEIAPSHERSSIVILNDDAKMVRRTTAKQEILRPFIILSTSRSNRHFFEVKQEHERIGGICRILPKPVGPSALRSALGFCTHAIKIASRKASRNTDVATENSPTPPQQMLHPSRRNSVAIEGSTSPTKRPAMLRSHTAPALSAWSTSNGSTESEPSHRTTSPQEKIEEGVEYDTDRPTITVDKHASLLKSSINSVSSAAEQNQFRILVIEDNEVLRNLLLRWLNNKGYKYHEAVDGQDGVAKFERDGPFDVVLLDLSMPILDGVEATAEIRKIESSREDAKPSRILALTGMSSLEDKTRAFDAGVDGYLVKPVPFKTLENIFNKLGLSP